MKSNCNKLSELKSYVDNLKDGQILSVELRGDKYVENPYSEKCFYYNGKSVSRFLFPILYQDDGFLF